ncbi:hypothetical protein BU15DRAFT_59503 [Melanogaster broomeanus]|nr:hypothetical protein BU15DRAFT_59503 [Melanogaster broomeanus]
MSWARLLATKTQASKALQIRQLRKIEISKILCQNRSDSRLVIVKQWPWRGGLIQISGVNVTFYTGTKDCKAGSVKTENVRFNDFQQVGEQVQLGRGAGLTANLNVSLWAGYSKNVPSVSQKGHNGRGQVDCVPGQLWLWRRCVDANRYTCRPMWLRHIPETDQALRSIACRAQAVAHIRNEATSSKDGKFWHKEIAKYGSNHRVISNLNLSAKFELGSSPGPPVEVSLLFESMIMSSNLASSLSSSSSALSSLGAAAPVAASPQAAPEAVSHSGELEGPMPGQSAPFEATGYDASLQKWYQRMISPNIGFLAMYANEQSQRWSSAILEKRRAMQTMLEAQKTIEDIETDVSKILNRETIEHMRSMFFRDVLDSSSDGQYLLAA